MESRTAADERLIARTARWLVDGGKLFVHIFTHREYAYLFEDHESSDWMAGRFFTGGMMPSDRLLLHFKIDLLLLRHWRLNGSYYARTAEAWLANMDRNRAEIVSVFSKNRWAGASRALVGARWRIFFMACAELWAYRGGEERLVRHYLFEK